MKIDTKKVKAELKAQKAIMTENKKAIVAGLIDNMKGESKDMATIRSQLSAFGKASVIAAKLRCKLG